MGRVRRLSRDFGSGDARFEELERGPEGPRVHPSREWVIEGNKRAGEEMSSGNHRSAGTLFDSLRRVA